MLPVFSNPNTETEAVIQPGPEPGYIDCLELMTTFHSTVLLKQNMDFLVLAEIIFFLHYLEIRLKKKKKTGLK